MYSLIQLFLAIIAIYSALKLPEDIKLYVPLACLIAMFIVGRLDKERFENREARKKFLKSAMEGVSKRDPATIQKQERFIIQSLLWPRGELILIDAVHSVLKDLGFRVATGGEYVSVDRIVRIPDTDLCFGLEILMSEEEVKQNHPKIKRALLFEKEKKGNEKTLVIASSHLRHPILEREQLIQISSGLQNYLVDCNISVITTYSFYQLWQKTKGREVNIFEVFRRIYFHPGGMFFSKEMFQTSQLQPET